MPFLPTPDLLERGRLDAVGRRMISFSTTRGRSRRTPAAQRPWWRSCAIWRTIYRASTVIALRCGSASGRAEVQDAMSGRPVALAAGLARPRCKRNR